jgi:3-keto-5-aminohexanoate cleavage enzyme
MQPLIINLAPTGAVPTRSASAHVPLTPDEISEDCARCCALGAAIVHLHAREPDGTPSYRIQIYREIIRKVRASAPDAIVCVSTTGRHFRSFEERSQVLDLEDDLKPDMASLTLGSMNFATQASVNEPAVIRALADRMRERGIVPELEVFDLGMIDYAKFLLDRGVLQPPLYFNLLLGSLGTLSATPLNLALLAHALPPGSTWAAAGIGRFQFPTNALAVAMDGHVRVGLEDNLYMDDAKLEPASNLALVERIVRLGRAIGRAVATPGQARDIIGLPQTATSV